MYQSVIIKIRSMLRVSNQAEYQTLKLVGKQLKNNELKRLLQNRNLRELTIGSPSYI